MPLPKGTRFCHRRTSRRRRLGPVRCWRPVPSSDPAPGPASGDPGSPPAPLSPQCSRRCSCRDTASTTRSSASWPSSAAPPSTRSRSCRTTPPTPTPSSSRAPRSPCRRAPRSPRRRARPAARTPQGAPRSPRAPIRAQVSKAASARLCRWDRHSHSQSACLGLGRAELCRWQQPPVGTGPCRPLRRGCGRGGHTHRGAGALGPCRGCSAFLISASKSSQKPHRFEQHPCGSQGFFSKAVEMRS